MLYLESISQANLEGGLMGVAIIGMGLPGVGKTTQLRKMANEMDAVYICADDIRKEVYGHPSVQSDPKKVWGVVHKRTRKALMAGKNVIIDGTHVKRVDRMATIQACNCADTITLIWYQAPVQVCIARNRRRKRVVPEVVIRKMSKILRSEAPKPYEGFDQLELISTAAPIY
jgi:predicted kinase